MICWLMVRGDLNPAPPEAVKQFSAVVTYLPASLILVQYCNVILYGFATTC
jgi:hypothetical protein